VADDGFDGGATAHLAADCLGDTHLKEDHRMGRNYLTGRDGDRINAVLAAAGYNFSLLLRWFEELLRALSLILWHALLAAPVVGRRKARVIVYRSATLRRPQRNSTSR
jgi:hypothetical protein